MNKISVEMGKTDVRYGWYLGEIDISYDELVSIFGEPTYTEEGNYKDTDTRVQREWEGLINGKLFTIYDYKIEGAYTENREWRIGGDHDPVVRWVIDYIGEKIGEVQS